MTALTVHNGRTWLHVATRPLRRRDDFVTAAAVVAGVTRAEILGPSMRDAIVHPRMAGMIAARDSGMTYEAIGALFNRSYTATYRACHRRALVEHQLREIERIMGMVEAERRRKAAA